MVRLKFFVLGVVCSFAFACAQEPMPLLREKVTMAYDKENGCELGDTVHFEAWVEREGKEGATDYSRVLYVELLTPNGSVVARKKLPLVDGRVKSELVVDTLYGSGFYELRAYTRYMTNWNDYQYFSRVLPVYVPASKLEKPLKEGERCINLATSRMTDPYSRIAEAMENRREVVFSLKQPIETNLMVFGHIYPKFKVPTEDDLKLHDRRMRVFINQGKEVLGGDAETDSMGRYALYFPDVKGEWNMRIVAAKPKGGRQQEAHAMNRYFVTVDRLFSPPQRYFLPADLKPKNFGMKKWKDDRAATKWASRFLDCDGASTSMKNNGYVSQGFYAFLGNADHRFQRMTGVASPTIPNVARDSTYHKFIDIDLLGNSSADPRTVCVDGPSYNGRPIVWIVNGAYRLVTGLSKPITDFQVFRPTRQPMPIYVDEVRSVYITENPEAFHSYVRCSVLEKRKPVTVFVTLHRNYIWDDSGLVSTFFDGFSE